MNGSGYEHPRAGYTLPVFACAGAIAALRVLQNETDCPPSVPIYLINPPQTVDILIEQVARLDVNSALGVTRSDPGDNLDLTRDTPIWVWVAWGPTTQTDRIELLGGEGLGKHADGRPAIYTYARQLLIKNLQPLLSSGDTIRVTIILPEGRSLAERTSNAAFGVVEGLSLLGTSGIAQPLSSPGQLAACLTDLRQKASQRPDCLVFCIGENGLDLARKLGIPERTLVKTANWLGPLLVEAGVQNSPAILLFGYHGKLLKLAGGIFHTHHHVADGRQEILAAYCAHQGMAHTDIQTVFSSQTAEAALAHLRSLDLNHGSQWTQNVYGAIAHQIDQRAQTYIYKHSQHHVQVGCVLFDRDRQIFTRSEQGSTLLAQVC